MKPFLLCLAIIAMMALPDRHDPESRIGRTI